MKEMLKIFMFVLLPTLLYPCLWLEGTTLDGEYKQFDDKTISSLFLRQSMGTTPDKNFNHRFYHDTNHTAEYEAINDISNENYKRAIDNLLQIEKETPGRYETASNLGTAYELDGNIPLAIQWIEEGIKRNKDSHLGTEWLHALILKTKLELQKNPHFLDKKHIIPLPNEFDEATVVTIDSKSYTIAQIRTALFYQLRERMIFVKPKSPIVADLLYSFAKIEEQTTVLNEAENLLNQAIEYGFSNKQDIEAIHYSASRSNKLHMMRIGAYISIALLLLILFYRYESKRANTREVNTISPVNVAFNIGFFLFVSFLIGLVLSGITLYVFKIFDLPDIPENIIFYLNSVLFLLFGIKISLYNFKLRHFKIEDPRLSIIYTILLYAIIVILLMFKSQKYLWGFAYLSIAPLMYLYMKYKLRNDT